MPDITRWRLLRVTPDEGDATGTVDEFSAKYPEI